MINLDNIRYYTCLPDEFVNIVFDKFSSNPCNKVIIVHINIRNYYYLNKDQMLKSCIREYSLPVFEGIGLKTGLGLRGLGFIPDLNGTDLYPYLMKRISDLDLSVFLLGAENRVIKEASENMSSNYPNLKLLGFHNGFFCRNDEHLIVDEINESKADVLIIGMGFPAQEEFVFRNRDKLNTSIIWNVGGLFDIISGNKPRAPKILRNLRLEWLFRFLLEPGRMLHRNTVCAIWSLGHIFLLPKKSIRL